MKDYNIAVGAECLFLYWPEDKPCIETLTVVGFSEKGGSVRLKSNANDKILKLTCQAFMQQPTTVIDVIERAFRGMAWDIKYNPRRTSLELANMYWKQMRSLLELYAESVNSGEASKLTEEAMAWL